jgi:Phage integrase family.
MSIQTKEYTSKKTGKTTTKYYACVFDPITNTTIWGKGKVKRKDAVKEEADLIDDIEKGNQKTSGNMKFKELAEMWFKSMENTYAESTFKGYKGYYKAQLSSVFDDIVVNKITPTHAQKFKNALSETHKPATVNKTMDLFSMMMDFAKKPLHLIKTNPCDDIKRDKVENPTHTTWDEKTIGYFFSLDIVKRSDYYEMLILSFTTALRPGEVCGISVDSLKDNNLLSLYRGYNKYGSITEMKTKRSHRPLSLDPFVYKCLLDRLEKKKEQKETFLLKVKEAIKNGEPFGQSIYNENDFLFTYENGEPITPNNYSRAFRSILRQHNHSLKEVEEKKGKIPKGSYYLPVIRLYDGRHSFATNTIMSGEVNEKVISEIMGSNVETILRNYVHVGKTMHQATLSKYSSKIFNFNDKKVKHS